MCICVECGVCAREFFFMFLLILSGSRIFWVGVCVYWLLWFWLRWGICSLGKGYTMSRLS